MTTVAAYVIVKDNELLLDDAAPDQTFDPFAAPDADLDAFAVLICRLRPSQEDIRLRIRLNNDIVGDDSLFNGGGKRTWNEVIEPGSLKDLDNELRVELLSPDGTAAPPGSSLGLSNVTMSYSIQV